MQVENVKIDKLPAPLKPKELKDVMPEAQSEVIEQQQPSAFWQNLIPTLVDVITPFTAKKLPNFSQTLQEQKMPLADNAGYFLDKYIPISFAGLPPEDLARIAALAGIGMSLIGAYQRDRKGEKAVSTFTANLLNASPIPEVPEHVIKEDLEKSKPKKGEKK